MSEVDIFMSRCIPEPNSGCWLWTGTIQEFPTKRPPYGFFRNKGVRERAHRASYRLFCGPIPDGQVVRHKCDVTLCVNPDHLCLGTVADNNRDMVERGRSLFGERHPRVKLTADQVIEIRKLRARGVLAEDLAAQFGVARSTIGYAVRSGWKCLAEIGGDEQGAAA